ncbi:MAG: NFACT family protein, partial [Pyrinomonadaceae bacterium]
MHAQLIREVVAELAPLLAGRAWGKVWQFSRETLAVDFRLRDGLYLFLSVEPQQPRLYLIERPLRALEKASVQPSGFAQVLRKHLGGARLVSLAKDEGDRVVRFAFASYDAAGDALDWTLVAQLTGRAANLLLLDGAGRIVDALREPRGDGQQIGETYQPPPPSGQERSTNEPALRREGSQTLSAALDAHYTRLSAERAFASRAGELRARLRQEIEKRRKLARNLGQDLREHGDAGDHKRA